MEKNQIEPQGYIAVSEKYRTARIKDEIMREVKTCKILFIANAKTVLLFDPSASPQEVLDSLDILKRDLKLRIKSQSRDEKVDIEKNRVDN
jgi:hypothetical protein